MIKITIPGEAVPQGRPRFSTRGGFPRAYDPAKSREFKSYVRLLAAQAMNGAPPIEGAVSLVVVIYRAIPKSFSKRKRHLALEGEVLPVTKSDLDNVVKSLTDAITGVIFRDDAQIVDLHACKLYDNTPRTEIQIAEVNFNAEM
jgi:Holliday junction resolvase RusA-like endonuclease